jgi:hypothetical protein
MGKEKINNELLDSLRSTLFNLESEDGWIKVEREELIDNLKTKNFDEIIVSRDIIEGIKKDVVIISISRKNGEFYLRDERNKEKREMDLKKLISELR